MLAICKKGQKKMKVVAQSTFFSDRPLDKDGGAIAMHKTKLRGGTLSRRAAEELLAGGL